MLGLASASLYFALRPAPVAELEPAPRASATTTPKRKQRSPLLPDPRTEQARVASWIGNPTGQICIVDANMDGTPDVVGYGLYLMALDGRTGGEIWNAGIGGMGTLYCDGHRHIVRLSANDFSFSGVSANSGNELWRSKLDDRIETIVFGKDCLVAYAINGASIELDTSDGTATSCPVKKPAKSLRIQPDTAHAAGVEVESAVSREAGRSRVLVRAHGGATWETQLPMMIADPFFAIIAASKHGVYVAGRQRGDGFVVARLDLRTGEILATHEQTDAKHAEPRFMQIKATDSIVFFQSFGMIHAYDPEELSPMWWAGTMWTE